MTEIRIRGANYRRMVRRDSRRNSWLSVVCTAAMVVAFAIYLTTGH